MKIWRFISVLLLACMAGACDDDFAGEKNDGNAAGQAKVSFGYEAKTVLKNGGQVRVPVCLDAPVGNVVKVTVKAEEGEANTAIAREGIDFNVPDRVVTIPAGDTLAYLAVDLLDNGKVEADREIKLTITGVYGGEAGMQQSVSLYVVSNTFVEFEKAKWEMYESANVETSSEEVRNGRFVPLTIAGELKETVTIVLEVQDGSAVEPTHFTVEKELVVTPGTTKVNVEVKPVDDDEVNTDRVFILKIKEVRGGNLLIGKTNSSCEVKILSEEILRTLSWEMQSQSQPDKEGILDIPVYLDKTPPAPFKVDIVTDGSTDAVEGVDYEILTSQLELNSAGQAKVRVKVLRNPEVNANRILMLNFANITDETIFIPAKSFTLTIENSDFPSFEKTTMDAIEDEETEAVISIPAVDRERTITLKYSSTENNSGTYFEAPSEVITVPAGATEVRLPLQVKYTLDYPIVSPEFTASIVKVDDFVLENAVNVKWVLVPCDYRKLLGSWVLTDENSDYYGGPVDVEVSSGDTNEERIANFKKRVVCKGILAQNEVATWYIDVNTEKMSGNVILRTRLFTIGGWPILMEYWGVWDVETIPVSLSEDLNRMDWGDYYLTLVYEGFEVAEGENPYAYHLRYLSSVVMTKK